jgi:hypothetical protein
MSAVALPIEAAVRLKATPSALEGERGRLVACDLGFAAPAGAEDDPNRAGIAGARHAMTEFSAMILPFPLAPSAWLVA